jgi:hypothetical protein
MSLPTVIAVGDPAHPLHHTTIHAVVNAFTVSGTNVGIGLTPAHKLDVLAAAQAGNFKSTGTQGTHALTGYQAGNSSGLDNAVAVNAASDNEWASTVFVAGVQRQRATLKVTHTKPAADDSDVNAIGVDLVGASTAARGLAIIPTNATTGDPILVRNNARDDFVVKGTGRVGIGVATAATPSGMVDIRPYDTSTRGLYIEAFASGTHLVELRDSTSAAQLLVSNAGQVQWNLAPRWNAAGIVQTTVGAAGGASAPPATPSKWLKVVDNAGTTLVVPAYLP